MNDKILKGLSKTLTDLQKTFGIIDHDVLLQKFDIDFSKYSVNWFKLYLSSRSFLVILRNNFSQPVSCSAPQGSLLGLPLFSIYVNDMSQIIKCALFLFANETCLACQHKDINKNEN